jgi:hypothetical protein
MVRFTLEQSVFLYDICVKYGSARKCHHRFYDERVSSRQTIHSLVNKLRSTGLLIDKKKKHKHQMLIKKLNDIGARLEHNLENL